MDHDSQRGQRHCVGDVSANSPGKAGRADEYRRKEIDGEEKGTDTVEHSVKKTDAGHCGSALVAGGA
jgi:hypothetical protein